MQPARFGQYLQDELAQKSHEPSQAELESLQLELNPSWSEQSWARMQYYYLHTYRIDANWALLSKKAPPNAL